MSLDLTTRESGNMKVRVVRRARVQFMKTPPTLRLVYILARQIRRTTQVLPDLVRTGSLNVAWLLAVIANPFTLGFSGAIPRNMSNFSAYI
ncbi:hypothetical protein BDV26DRAFT_261118 [Aspergillus bertholletiae]|uniref:Uncharacterized protein n=1 Tax=Aspergillus bertholletiae TaxID=1226010 RepID=A0A5N7BAF2_9EURO|nr:hypothetical protein BDV26DRAFT_261118 [Aspergillus bertholletiae]